LAALNFESTHKRLPSAGWGYKWTGDPDAGFGEKQPGGWVYQVMPFLEEGAVFLIGAGLEQSEKNAVLQLQKTTSVPGFACPSRRPGGLAYGPEDSINAPGLPPDSLVAKSDYAGNGGCIIPNGAGEAGAERVQCLQFYSRRAEDPSICAGLIEKSEVRRKYDGAIVPRFGVKISQIKDGTSKTLFAAERYLPKRYYDPNHGANVPFDNNSMYQGHDWDVIRYASAWEAPGGNMPGVPLPDTDESDVGGGSYRFGGPHTGGFLAVHCDDSVHNVDFDIDPLVWQRVGARKDGGGTCPGHLSEL
jgi:hypothetical protein